MEKTRFGLSYIEIHMVARLSNYDMRQSYPESICFVTNKITEDIVKGSTTKVPSKWGKDFKLTILALYSARIICSAVLIQ